MVNPLYISSHMLQQILCFLFCSIVFLAFLKKDNSTCRTATFYLRGTDPWAYMSGIYVISGNWTSMDRKQRWKKQMAKVGLQDRIEVWPGIRTPLNGHHGAWLAHQSLLSNALEKKLFCITVFEDDVIFTNNFVKHRKRILRETLRFISTKDTDILYLGGNIQSLQLVPQEEHFVRVHAWALLAYIIYEDGMRFFMNRTFPNVMGGTIDGISYSLKNAYSVFPSVCVHPSNVTSDTTGTRRNSELTKNWDFQEKLLHKYASEVCHSKMASIKNFGAIDFRWKLHKDLWQEPVVTCIN